MASQTQSSPRRPKRSKCCTPRGCGLSCSRATAAIADAVARKLEIDEIIAEVLPEQNGKVVSRLQREGRRVAMAGDGINDAPALAAADVGIAMGTGTDVAMESAAVTLVQGDLRGIVRASGLVRRHLPRSCRIYSWPLFTTPSAFRWLHWESSRRCGPAPQ